MAARQIATSTAFAAAFALAASLGGASLAPAHAADYYAGKTIRILHAGGGRGSYMLYTRLFAQHFAEHVAGKPTVVADFMSGAGGLNAANYVYNAAPKDGTVLLMPLPGTATADLLYGKKARFDTRKFNWIGHITALQSAVGVWKTAPATTIAEARKTQVLIGATGPASELSFVPRLMNAVLGTKFKLIMGYKGLGAVDLAMENGEVQGRGGAMTAWQPHKPSWFKPVQKIVFLAQLGTTRHPWIPNVPLLSELAKTKADREVLDLAARGTVLSRAVAAPPGMPANLVAELRADFDATINDPAFIADMKKHKLLMINRLTVPEIGKFLEETHKTPKPVVDRLRQMLSLKKS